MRKLLALSVAAAALSVVALSAPAGAVDRKADGIANGQAAATDLSARRYYRRYGYRYGHRYYGPRYRYYGGPYRYGYYPYGYYPYYYRPYYYRPPGIYFGFGF